MGRLTKRPDWDIRLARYIETQLGLPFIWGQTNCVMLAVRSLEAMTGACPLPEDIVYTTREEALIAAEKCPVVPFLKAHYTIQPVRRRFEQRGDLALGQADGMPAMHIVMGEYVVSSDPSLGVFRAPFKSLPEAIQIIRIL